MSELKSERHHWWPECVSEFWKDDDGCAHQIQNDGKVSRAPPKNFGVIGNAHHIKMGDGEPSVWDHSFEQVFQHADSNFPGVIRWLNTLERRKVDAARSRQERFLPQSATDDQIRILAECIISLAVRCPMNREAAVRLAEHFRGPLPQQERNVIIGMNMRDTQRSVVQSIGVRGKYAVLYSPNREFIFGDGFFHSIRSPMDRANGARILAPLTPNMAVLYASPMQYRTEPRLVTMVLEDEEVKFLNDTVQVYARKFLLYRSQKPELTDDFRSGKHLEYASMDHPINRLIDDLSGIQPQQRLFGYPLGRGGL